MEQNNNDQSLRDAVRDAMQDAMRDQHQMMQQMLQTMQAMMTRMEVQNRAQPVRLEERGEIDGGRERGFENHEAPPIRREQQRHDVGLPSDLPTAVPAGQELNGQKRNGSPSLLVACNKICAKKQCFIGKSSSSLKSSNFESSFKPEEADVVHCEDIDGSGGKPDSENDGGGAILRRCNKTPNSCLMKTGYFVPDLSTHVLGAGETPRSSRKSMFSPGVEFWNEAIQVADGLLAPVDKLPESLCFLKSGGSGNKLLRDKSSCAVPQGAKCFSKLDGDDLATQDVVLKGCAKPIEKPVETPKISLSGSQQNEASPLPVKHFDFCHEEHSHHHHVDIGEISVHAGSGHVSSVSAKQKGQVTSDIPKHFEDQETQATFKEKPISSLNMSSGKGGMMTQGNDSKHIHSDKNLSHDLPQPGCHGYCEEASTPSSSMVLNYRLKLTNWLPPEVCNVYMKKGISKLYPWQVECLLVGGVLEKRNLVYCASTSAGKSFVAEILMLRRVISTGKMALLVLPYVSICAEKADHLELLLEPLGKHVRSFYGNQGGASLPKDTSVAVCTIEKANSLINRLLEEGRLSELGIIVIDELHMVGDQQRGYLLELMLTKLLYASGQGNLESSSGESSGSSSGKADPSHGLQIVGMSATMPNVAAVADWLQAALYQTDFRPVPLEEYIKVGNTIFDKKMDIVRKIPKTAELGGKDPDHIVELCNEVVQEGHSVLLFCSSRKGCESTARHVSKFLKKFSVGGHEVDREFNDASSAVEALRRCPTGLDPILEETLPSGVAYHHAGLTVEEREIVEACYRKGLVRVLTATSTLAAGVNLPARRVIFRQPQIGPQMAPSWFEQYQTYKNGQILEMYDGFGNSQKTAKGGTCFFAKVSESMHNGVVAEQINNVSQVGNLQQNTSSTTKAANEDSPSHCLPPGAIDKNMILMPKKRKSATSELLPWHKEVIQGSRRMQTISIAELGWAQTANRLIEKVEDEFEIMEDGTSIARLCRRLVLTTQLMQQLIPCVPARFLNADATAAYGSLMYFGAKLGLGDACSFISCSENDSRMFLNNRKMRPEELKTDEKAGDSFFFKVMENFIGRLGKLESSFLRLEKRSSLLDLRVECQVLEKFGDNAYRVELPDVVFISDVFNIRHLTPYTGENSSLRSSFSEEGESDEDISSDQGSGQSSQSLDVPVPATQSQQDTSGKPAPGSLRRSKRLLNKRA